MSNEFSNGESNSIEACEHELTRLRKEWWCFLALGITLVVAGIAAIAYPFLASAGIVIFLGVILIVSGVATLISAFWAGKWSAFALQVLVGLLYVVAGWVISDAPVASTAMMTLMLAGFFVVAGGFRIVTALVYKFPQWGWALVNGIITLMLGLIVFRSFKQLPEDPAGAFWIIGLLIGLELLFNGWTWIMLGLAVKDLPAPAGDPT